MTFVITYPESSFTSLGANQVRREKLRRAILQASAITDTLEDIRPSNYGASAPETMSATGRVWGFYFAGAGPSMAGSGQAALDAIVAAHDGVYVEPSSPNSGGSANQVWTKKPDGSYDWVTPASGGGNVNGPGTTIANRLSAWSDTSGTALGQTGITASGASSNNLSGVGVVSMSGNLTLTAGSIALSAAGATVDGVDMDKVIRGLTTAPLGTTSGGKIPRVPLADSTGVVLEASVASVDDNGTISTQSIGVDAPPLKWNMNSVANELNVRNSTPVNALSKNQTYCLVNGATSNDDFGLWFHRNGTANSLDWYRWGPPGFFDGFLATFVSTTSFTVGPGCLCLTATNSRGNTHSVNSTFTVDLTKTAQPLGTDSGSWTANTTFYIYLIRSNTGVYSVVCSSISSGPILSGANFTASGYTNVARIGHVRTGTSAATLCQFFDSGRSNLRRRFVDESTSTFRPLLNGTATSLTEVVIAAGAVSAMTAITTNASASANFYINTTDTDRTLVATVPISQTTLEKFFPHLNSNGAFVYRNSAVSGATTVNILSYEYEAYGPP